LVNHKDCSVTEKVTNICTTSNAIVATMDVVAVLNAWS